MDWVSLWPLMMWWGISCDELAARGDDLHGAGICRAWEPPCGPHDRRGRGPVQCSAKFGYRRRASDCRGRELARGAEAIAPLREPAQNANAAAPSSLISSYDRNTLVT